MVCCLFFYYIEAIIRKNNDQGMGDRFMNKEDLLLTNIKNVHDKIVYLNKPVMESRLEGYTSTEIHCIEAIENSAQPNVSQIAQTLFMTRGAISKLTKKLIKKDAISSYKNPDNKKEIYFKLTDKGREAFNTHEQLHKEFKQRDAQVFNAITDNQYEAMMTFLNHYNTHLEKEIHDKEK